MDPRDGERTGICFTLCKGIVYGEGIGDGPGAAIAGPHAACVNDDRINRESRF